jgi:hypothetical protein
MRKKKNYGALREKIEGEKQSQPKRKRSRERGQKKLS